MKSVKPNFLNSWYIKLLRECKKSSQLEIELSTLSPSIRFPNSRRFSNFAQSTSLKNVQLEVFGRAISTWSQSRKSDYHYSHDRIHSKHPIRALIHPWARLSWWIRASGTENVFLETVDGVKESDDESGQPETISYRRQAFATRLPRLVSRFQFPPHHVLHHQPRFHPFVKRTIKRTSLRLKDEAASPRGNLPFSTLS